MGSLATSNPIPLKQLALAISQQEGWFDPDKPSEISIPHSHNNPGNLRWAPERLHGAMGANGYFQFPDRFWGAAALLNDVRAKMLDDLSLSAAIHIYCPTGDSTNDPDVYVRNVAEWLGIANPRLAMKVLFSDPGRVVDPWLDFPEPASKRLFD